MKHTSTFGMGLEGFYKVAVVDAQGEEIWRQSEWNKNLILNQGMDGLATNYLAPIMRYSVAGTGSRVNSITSSASQASVIEGGLVLDPQAGGIQNFNAEIWGGWTGSLSTGDIIKFANGTEVKVGTVGATTCAVTPTSIVTTQSFTIWKTAQIGLQSEIKRGGSGIAGSSYLVGVGNCGTTITQNVVTHLRTYDFSVEISSMVYKEVGIAWATSGPTTVFSRIVLPEAITITEGQRMRLIYQLQATFQPTASQYVLGAAVSGWPVSPSTNTNMTESIQLMKVSTIDPSDGSSDTVYSALEPPSVGDNCSIFASTNSQSLVTFGTTPINRNAFGVADAAACTADVYVAGSYTLYKNATFSMSQINYQNLRSFGFGAHNPTSIYAWGTTGQAYAVLFEQSQSKYNTQTLTMTFTWAWSRVLA